MEHAKLRPVILAGTSAGGHQPWQPRLQLLEQAPETADHRPPVLYIHGATFPSENAIFFKFGATSWADALNAAGFSVWGLDFAGFGRSEAYPEMASDQPPAGNPLGRAPDAARQIERAIRTIIADSGAAKLSIIAHSWGTMAAGHFAGNHPDLVDRLVFFGPIARRRSLTALPPLGPWRFLTVEEQKRRFIEDVPQGEPSVLVEADFPAWADLYLKADPASASRLPPSVKTPNGPLADIMAAWAGLLAYDPGRIRASVFIIRGAWDGLCQDTDVAWLKRALVNSPLVSDIEVPRATHLMHLESARTVLYAAVNAFLKSQ